MKRVIIMGAAGRDFHDFLVYFKKGYDVVAFTAAQIPGIAKRTFPAKLAGAKYPRGIPIYSESRLSELIKKYKVDEVCLSYSDLPHEEVMHKACKVLAAGASFRLLSYADICLKSNKPIISVCAVRTGCGKSQVSRKIAHIFRERGKRVVVVRHPMPYGDLVKQRVQRFGSQEDIDRQKCTIEEREEYEPYLKLDIPVYAGVDYLAILRRAEKEADIIIWDGGNNDIPFFKTDMHIVVVDPLRSGHETRYYPGEENLYLADVIIVNKVNAAPKKDVAELADRMRKLPQKPKVVLADSKVYIDEPKLAKGKRAVVIEDGPTLTHGGMSHGAGAAAAKMLNAKMVDPRRYAVGSLKEVYQKYKLGNIIPAMGYSKKQMRELEQTINKIPADVVIDGSPSNLKRLLKVNKHIVDVTYELEGDNLKQLLRKFK